MIDFPKLTIVTPSFNQGQYLEETIDSILGQGYPNLEYIIIDGGSTDNSVDIIRKYASLLTYWVSEKDRGQSDAINKGLKRATGEIVTWINSDDLLCPGILNKVPAYFADPGVGLIHGRNIAFGEGITESVSSFDPQDAAAKYLGSVAFPQPASFFRRRVLLETGYLNERLHYGMDYDLFVRIALNYRILPISDVVSRYRFHASSKSVSEAFRFAPDWARVFSRVLRSFPGTEDLIESMRSVDLYEDGDDSFPVHVAYDHAGLRRAYLYFLQEQAQCYYSDYRLAQSARIARQVRALDPVFFKKYRLDQILFRSQFLNKPLLQLLKRIAR